MKTKHTVTVGRFVLETVQFEIEAEASDVEAVALAAAAELDEDAFSETLTPNIPEELFMVATADHHELAYYNMDDPPAKQKPIEELVEHEMYERFADFAATVILADIANGDGKVILTEWMDNTDKPSLMISDIVSDWVEKLEPIAERAYAFNEALASGALDNVTGPAQ